MTGNVKPSQITDMVINKADKDSTIVIMDKSDYVDGGNKPTNPYNKTLQMNSRERST